MKRMILLIALIMCSVFFISGVASTATEQSNDKVAVAKIFTGAGVGISEQKYYLAKKPGGSNFEVSDSSFYVGKAEGTRFYYSDYKTGVGYDTPTRKFRTDIHTRDYGMTVSARFSRIPAGVFETGFGRKSIHTDPSVEYLFPPNGASSSGRIGFTDVQSHPFHFKYTHKISEPWKIWFGFDQESVKMVTSFEQSVSTKIYTLGTKREAKKFDMSASVAKYSSDKAPQNTNLEAEAVYKPWKGLKLFFKAGMFTNGVPVAGGVYSGAGGQFIFSYLNDPQSFNKIFSEKFGYFTLGASYDLNFH
jgi:hypothetical protein